LFSADFKQADLFWNDFYRPSGFIETLGAALFADKTRFALLGLHRAAARPPFSHEDIADLERLLPHMERVLQLRRRFAAMNARADGLEGLVDQLDAGVVTLDPAGGVIFTNRAARDVFARRDGIGLDRAGRLVADRPETRVRLSALLASVVKGGSGGMMAVPRVNGSYALLVAPAPGGVGDWFAAPYGSGRAVVLIHDPDRRPRDAEEVLQAALGLTPGAARLVAALAADQDLKSFSEATGVTIHTARFHLRTALARTQTRTQSELVRVAVRLLRDFTLRRG
jgi:DNA-binding CsgD family transcriptional regulator